MIKNGYRPDTTLTSTISNDRPFTDLGNEYDEKQSIRFPRNSVNKNSIIPSTSKSRRFFAKRTNFGCVNQFSSFAGIQPDTGLD